MMLPFQARLVTDRSPIVACLHAHGIGITWALAYAACEAAATGSSFYYRAPTQRDAMGFMSYVRGWLASLGEPVSWSTVDLGVSLRSGRRIIASTMPPPADWRGVYCVDHATWVEHLGVPDVPVAMGRCRVILASSAGYAHTQFARVLRDPRADASVHLVTLERAFKDGFYRRVCEQSGIAWSIERERSTLARCYEEPLGHERYGCVMSPEYVEMPVSSYDDAVFPRPDDARQPGLSHVWSEMVQQALGASDPAIRVRAGAALLTRGSAPGADEDASETAEARLERLLKRVFDK